MHHLREISKNKWTSIKLIESYIKNLLNKRSIERKSTLAAEEKDLVTVLSCLGKVSLDLRRHLKIGMSNCWQQLPSGNLDNLHNPWWASIHTRRASRGGWGRPSLLFFKPWYWEERPWLCPPLSWMLHLKCGFNSF